MPSDVDCIEHAVSLVARHCLAGEPPTPRLRFRLQVAVAEALANAVVRGNREDPSKQVIIEAELLPDVASGSTSPTRAMGSDPDDGAGAAPARSAEPHSGPRPIPYPQARGRRPLQRARNLHLHDAQPPVARLDDILESLGALVGGRVRLWRFDGRGLRIAGGPDPGWTPTRPRTGGEVPTPTGATRLDPLDIEGYWVETAVRRRPASRRGRGAGAYRRVGAARRRAAARVPGRGAGDPLSGDRSPLSHQRAARAARPGWRTQPRRSSAR